MNRNEAKKLAPIIKAFGDGKDVQYHSMGRHWITADEEYNPVFDSTVEWRIKPEPREFWINPETGHYSKLIPGFLTDDWIKVREVLDDE